MSIARYGLPLAAICWSVVAGCSVPTAPARHDLFRAEKLLEQGNAALARGGLDGAMEARALFELAEANSPADARVLDGYGCVDFVLGDLNGAESFFRAAIAANPRYGRGYGNLARVQELQGNLVSAEGNYRRALVLSPNDADMRNNFAVFMARMKGISAVVLQELIKASVGSGGGDPTIRRNRCIASGGRGC